MTNLTIKVPITKTESVTTEIELELPYYCKSVTGANLFKVLSEREAIRVMYNSILGSAVIEMLATDVALSIGEVPSDVDSFLEVFKDASDYLNFKLNHAA